MNVKLIDILKDNRLDNDEKRLKVFKVFIDYSSFIEVESLFYGFYTDIFKLEREYSQNPYDENYVSDVNKSVKWNREEAERLHNEFIKNKEESIDDIHIWKKIVNNALIKYVSSYFGISLHNARVLYEYFSSIKNGVAEALYSINDFISILNKLDFGEKKL